MKSEFKKVIKADQPLVEANHETLATNFIEDCLNGQARTFSVTDMWNLQKKHRSALEMRRWLN
jgi:hypothetical protein